MEILMTSVRQKRIAEAIYKANFKPKDFELKTKQNDLFEIIYLNEPNYNFQKNYKDSYRFSPGKDGAFSSYADGQHGWDTTILAIERWLSCLYENIQIGDPWAEVNNIDSERINIGGTDGFFTKEEVVIIDEKLDIILEALKGFNVDLKRIKVDIDYLKTSGGKVSKKDWGLMVMGSVMGWGVDKVVPSDKLNEIWHTILHTLSSQNLIG